MTMGLHTRYPCLRALGKKLTKFSDQVPHSSDMEPAHSMLNHPFEESVFSPLRQWKNFDEETESRTLIRFQKQYAGLI